MALYGCAGPSRTLMNSFMLGIGLCSLVVNLLWMILMAIIPNDNLTIAVTFFTLAAFYLLICTFFSFTFLRDNLKYY